MALTPEQQACVDTLEGPLDISAGAGSGKTFTLTRRIVEALKNPACEMEHIDQVLAITFTNKAANELKGRTRSTLRAEGMQDEALKVDTAWISTIHGMCARILRESALEFGVDPAFTVLEEHDARALLSEALSEVIGVQEDYLEWDSYKELFDAYRVRSYNGRGESVEQLVIKICTTAAGMINGFDDIRTGPVPTEPSVLVRELLVAYENILPMMEGQKQTKTMIVNQERAQNIIDALHNFLLSEEQSHYEFCNLLDGLPLPGGNVSKDFKEELLQLKATHAATAQEAALGYGFRILQQGIEISQQVQARYDAKKRDQGYLDNADLMKLTYQAFDVPQIAERYKNKFKLVMVDEFQDTDRLQIEIIRQLAGEKLKHLCTVGDAQQSIYRFRGADINAYYDFRTSLKSMHAEGALTATSLSLTKNFRSHRDVLSFVQYICGQPRVFGDQFLALDDGYDGAGYKASLPRIKIAATIQPPTGRNNTDALCDPIEVAADQVASYFAEMHEAGHPLSDMALLLRSMGNAEVYAQAIRKRGFPCVIAGGSVFSNAPEVALLNNLVQVLVNAYHSEALMKVLSSELLCLSAEDFLQVSDAAQDEEASRSRRQGELARGFARLKGLSDSQVCSPSLQQAVDLFSKAQEAIRFEPLSQVALTMLRDSGWIARLEARGPEGLAIVGNLLKGVRLLEAIEQKTHGGPARTAAQFEVQLKSMKEAPGALSLRDQDAIKIMTVHASKGLEFPLVALAELESISGSKRSNRFMAEPVGTSAFMTLLPPSSCFDGTGQLEKVLKAVDQEEYAGITEERVDAASTLGEFYTLVKSVSTTEDAAEKQRLFYVAATRAKEALLISIAIKEQTSDPLNAYKGIHDDIRAALCKDDTFSSTHTQIDYGGTQPLEFTAVSVGLVEDAASAQTDLYDEVLTKRKIAAIQPYRLPKERRALQHEPTGLVSYSSLAEQADKQQIAGEKTEAKSDKATDFGSAFHRLAQIVALESSDVAQTHFEAIAQTYGVVDRTRLQIALTNWLESSVFERAMTYATCLPEVPFCVPFDEVFLEGEIDLLCSSAGQGKAFVVDYKTGGSIDETHEALYEKHLFQAQCYAYALLCNGYEQVEIFFARVEQLIDSDIQGVEFFFSVADRSSLHQTIASHLS